MKIQEIHKSFLPQRFVVYGIPTGSSFDMVGMDFVELDISKSGNRYALVFQDY